MAREVVTAVSGEPKDGGKRGILSFFKELPVLIALALGIALIIKAFLIQAFFIPSGSMEHTLEVRDRVLVNKLTYRFHQPERGDVIVFKEPAGDICAQKGTPGFIPPEECNRNAAQKAVDWFGELFGIPTSDAAKKDYIKRIVALPGETFEMREGVIYINGKKTNFKSNVPRAKGGSGPQLDETKWTPVKIPEEHYFVMGDNRGNSSDSRVFGPIDREKVIGKAFVIVWPPKRFAGL